MIRRINDVISIYTTLWYSLIPTHSPTQALLGRVKPAKMPPALRRIILLAAAALLWSTITCVAGDDDSTFLPSPPPGSASPFPFCPARPAGASTGPFPWSPPAPAPPLQSPPSPSSPVAVFPQDPGFLSSAACAVSSAVAWLPLLAVFSAFLVIFQ